MIENTGKDVPRPWRWWFVRDGAQVEGFAASKREARQAIYARMGVMPADSAARDAYLKTLGVE